VEGLLDGYDANSYVSGAQSMEITGSWTFDGPVSIIKDISVSGTVDGIDLDDFKNRDSLNERKDTYVINADVEIESDAYFDNLLVANEINKYSYDEAFGHLLLFVSTFRRLHVRIEGSFLRIYWWIFLKFRKEAHATSLERQLSNPA
jgi:hypothetical protein